MGPECGGTRRTNPPVDQSGRSRAAQTGERVSSNLTWGTNPGLAQRQRHEAQAFASPRSNRGAGTMLTAHGTARVVAPLSAERFGGFESRMRRQDGNSGAVIQRQDTRLQTERRELDTRQRRQFCEQVNRWTRRSHKPNTLGSTPRLATSHDSSNGRTAVLQAAYRGSSPRSWTISVSSVCSNSFRNESLQPSLEGTRF